MKMFIREGTDKMVGSFVQISDLELFDLEERDSASMFSTDISQAQAHGSS